jgi:hypothetical protein
VSYPLIVLLAEGPKNTGPDFGKASPVGLLVVILLLIAVFFLVWSMNRHLKKAREHFAEAAAPAPVADAQAAADGGAPAANREPTGEPGG